MRVLVCQVGGLGPAVSVLPTLDALANGLDGAEITVLCGARQAGLMSMAVPGVRPVAVDPATLVGARGMLRIPALARQIGPVDVALICPGESRAAHYIARTIAPRRIGFQSVGARPGRLLTDVLDFDPTRSVPDLTLDLARLLLEWPSMPLDRVAPLPLLADLWPDPMMGMGMGMEMEMVPDFGGAPDLGDDGVSDVGTGVDFPFDPLDMPRGEETSPHLPADPVSLLPGGEPYGVIHPGAGSSLQRWGTERFASLATALEARYGFRWHLVDESRFDLVDLAALVAGARIFVGCHAGPLQLAAAQGVPWVAIGGPTSYAWDPPWRDVPGQVLRAGLDCQPCALGTQVAPPHCASSGACMNAVNEAMVETAIDQVLQEKDRQSASLKSFFLSGQGSW